MNKVLLISFGEVGRMCLLSRKLTKGQLENEVIRVFYSLLQTMFRLLAGISLNLYCNHKYRQLKRKQSTDTTAESCQSTANSEVLNTMFVISFSFFFFEKPKVHRYPSGMFNISHLPAYCLNYISIRGTLFQSPYWTEIPPIDLEDKFYPKQVVYEQRCWRRSNFFDFTNIFYYNQIADF